MDYQKLFNLFIGNDPNKTLINQPFKRDGKYCATDAHSLIFISCEGLDLNFPEQGGPAIERVIPSAENCRIEISVADVEKQLIPNMIDEETTVGADKVCEECAGEGEVKWKYSGNRDYECMMDCPICGGSGSSSRSRTIKTGKKVASDTKAFEMLDVVFTYRELRRLINAAQLIGVQTITKVFGEGYKPNLFVVGDFKILVCPLVSTEWADDYVTKINFEEKAQA